MNPSTGQPRRRFAPSRRLVLASPAGTYTAITLAPGHGWSDAGTAGGLLAAAILCAPALLRASAKAAKAAGKKDPAKDPKKKTR